MRRAAPRHHSSPDPHVSAAHRGPAALGTCGAQKQRSEVVGERRPVGGAALEEGVAPLDGLVGHVGQTRGLAREDLLARQVVVGQV